MERPDREDMAPGDEAPPEQPPAGEDQCPDCEGTGGREDLECPTCGGTGRVVEGVGGG
jgi:DnaJ-class molecular chaperone